MKIKLTILILVILSLLALGCGLLVVDDDPPSSIGEIKPVLNKDNQENNKDDINSIGNESNKDNDKKEKDYKNEDNETQEIIESPKGQPEASLSNVDIIKSSLKTGLTKNDILLLFGEKYQEVYSAMDEEKMWRYDFITEDNYQFTNENQLDFADIEGLLTGAVEMQLFIGWTDEELVKDFSLLYSEQKGERIIEYRVFPDGTTREGAIF
ncbi:MAG: hypothetical protein SCK28_10965 [Bacillota bacterium]|nr:hypothetical protein [Bacillota bacterium]